MNTRDIECFIKVYECRSINIAAEQLFITPQGLSRIIVRLERELNCQLFNKDRAGSIPTDCGDLFYRYAVSAKRDYDRLVSEISHIARLERGVIRFGYSFGVMAGLSFDLTKEFEKKYPEYRLDSAEMPDVVVEELVAKGELDVGFCSCSRLVDFSYDLIHRSRILFVPHINSKLRGHKEVTVLEAAEEPMTLRNDNFATTRIMKQEFEKCGAKPEIILNTGGILRSIKMVRDGNANTVIIDSVADQFGESGLQMIPFEENITWPLYMITKKEEGREKAVEAFTRFIRKNIRT